MLDGEAGERKVADMIGTEGEDEDEEGVERDHPEHVLQEHQRPVQTCNNIVRSVAELEPPRATLNRMKPALLVQYCRNCNKIGQLLK